MSKGMLLILSGPSGSGKGTVVNRIRDDENLSVSISVTTRTPRVNEIDGVNYFFRTKDEFYDMLRNDALLEHALFLGNHYGTPREYVEEQIDNGKTVILEIEVNGALQVKEKFPEAVLVFLLPPTFTELKNRLINRATESRETIEERLKRAREEVKLADKYDYLVINDNIERAADDIRLIVSSETLKTKRSQEKITEFNEN